MKPAATLTAFAVGLAAVFGAACTTGAAVPALTDPAPAVTTPRGSALPAPTDGGSPMQHHDSDPAGDGHGP